MIQTILIPGLRLTGGGNSREHDMARVRRVATERFVVMSALRTKARREDIVFPVLVTVTAVSAGTKDRDNASSAAKTVVDTIAAWLGVDDGKAERAGVVAWHPGAQRKGPRGHFAVEIRIEHSVCSWTPDELAAALERAKAVPKKPKARRAAQRGWGLRAIGRVG